MMSSGWFYLSNDQIRFSGRITREPIDRWLREGEGARLLVEAQRHVGFTILGRERAARRALWRSVAAAVSTQSVQRAIQAEADKYLARLAALAYSDALPHLHIDLHRLVAVPRALVDHTVFSDVVRHLESAPSVLALDRSLRLFLAARLVTEMDSALASARPRVRHPIPAWEQWSSVGVNADVAWTVPFSAGLPDRRGHFHVYEMPRSGMARKGRRKIAAAIDELDEQVSSLTRAERVDIVGRAAVA
jgi:hypothetical protein